MAHVQTHRGRLHWMADGPAHPGGVVSIVPEVVGAAPEQLDGSADRGSDLSSLVDEVLVGLHSEDVTSLRRPHEFEDRELSQLLSHGSNSG